jgi:hypothetical protein
MTQNNCEKLQFSRHSYERTVARTWTQWLKRLPVHMHICTFAYIRTQCTTAYAPCIYSIMYALAWTPRMSAPYNQLFTNARSHAFATRSRWDLHSSGSYWRSKHITKNVPHKYTFLKISCYQARRFNRGKHVNAVGYCTCFSGLVNMFVFVVCKFQMGDSN